MCSLTLFWRALPVSVYPFLSLLLFRLLRMTNFFLFQSGQYSQKMGNGNKTIHVLSHSFLASSVCLCLSLFVSPFISLTQDDDFFLFQSGKYTQKMGNGSGKEKHSKLTRKDIDFLMRETNFKEDAIKVRYKESERDSVCQRERKR